MHAIFVFLRRFCLCLVITLFTAPLFAKDTPIQVIEWPVAGTPALRFTFGKFRQLPGTSNLRGYVMDTVVQNLSPKLVSSARFSVYLFDKNKVRVGEDVILLSNLGPGETVKFETTVAASGTPVSVSIQDQAQVPKTIALTVNSVPQGAMVKVDGTDVGTTPRMINLSVGRHLLSFSKEGFNTGNMPLEISASDVSGGTVSYELGTAAFDSIELRDGSVLNGDLLSVSGMDVEIRVGGVIQHIDRNKIKRVILVQRDNPVTNPAPTTTQN
jgi:hypothetical protein